MSKDVVLFRGDDWQAVYIDGELADQGHSTDWMNVINLLGCNIYNYEPREEWLNDRGDFPESIQEVEYE